VVPYLAHVVPDRVRTQLFLPAPLPSSCSRLPLAITLLSTSGSYPSVGDRVDHRGARKRSMTTLSTSERRSSRRPALRHRRARGQTDPYPSNPTGIRMPSSGSCSARACIRARSCTILGFRLQDTSGCSSRLPVAGRGTVSARGRLLHDIIPRSSMRRPVRRGRPVAVAKQCSRTPDQANTYYLHFFSGYPITIP